MALVQHCPVCDFRLRLGLQSWHWQCVNCGYEGSDFEPAINEDTAHQKLDERFREKGLKSLRLENFEKLLDSIVRFVPTGRLLDVGSAHGWFIEAAQRRGFQAMGIEPDMHFFNSTVGLGLNVRQGYFPDVLAADERFQVIIFNDVFEHIPDAASVLKGCERHLSPDGVLVINLPSSSGVFYNSSKLLSRFGAKGSFERLWQKSLPSPHLHYFNAVNLRELLNNSAFEEVYNGQLAVLKLKGLFTRISYTKDHSLIARLLIWTAVAVALPLLKIMPSDIIYSVSKRNDTDEKKF